MKEIYMLVAGGVLILILGVALYLKKTGPVKVNPVDPLVGEFVETLNDDQLMKLMGLSLKHEDLSRQFADYLYNKVDADFQKRITE